MTAAHVREVGTHRSWQWLGTAAGVAFLAVLCWLIADHVKHIDWPGVRRALAAYPPLTLAGAAVLVAASHFTYACYDLLGKRYAHHRLPVRRVLGVAFVSYAFNLNLGTLVGGVGFRLRLYHRVGLGAAQIARVIALAIVTNWSGWFLLTGSVFAARQVPLPESFTFGAGALQVIGVAMLALPLAYVALCFRSRRAQIALAKPRVHVAERADVSGADRHLDPQLAADWNHRLAADAARARVRDGRGDPAQRCHARRADAYPGGSRRARRHLRRGLRPTRSRRAG